MGHVVSRSAFRERSLAVAWGGREGGRGAGRAGGRRASVERGARRLRRWISQDSVKDECDGDGGRRAESLRMTEEPLEKR